MHIDRIDHVVLTVATSRRPAFLSARARDEGSQLRGRPRALAFGNQKFNLHQAGKEFEPKADRPTPGSADFCLITTTPIAEVVAHLNSCGVRILDGPVQRTGATGPILSVYFRDPDLNLIEVSNALSIA